VGLEADILRTHAAAEKIRSDAYAPDILVGLGDGGLALMMLFSDALDVKTVRHVPVGADVGKYLRRRDFEGRNVLVVGGFENKVAAKRLLDAVWEYGPSDVRTASLEKTPEFSPDYYPTKKTEARKEDALAPKDKIIFFTEELLKLGTRGTENRSLITPVWSSDPKMLGRRNNNGDVVTATEDVLDRLIASFKDEDDQKSVISVLQYLVKNARDDAERKDILDYMKRRGQLKALKDTIRGFGDLQASFSYREVYAWIMEPHQYKNINHVSILQAVRKLEGIGLLIKDEESEGAYRVPADIERRWNDVRKNAALDNVESLVLKTICIKRGLMLAGLFDGDVRDAVAGRGL
jgi:hypothetical protein